MGKSKKLSILKKKLKKFRDKVGPHFRIPIAPPNQPHKSKKDYNRRKEKEKLRRELNE